MAITQVTSNVIEDNTIRPNKLTTGGPSWDSIGGLSAAAFVGDGTRLTGIIGSVSDSTILQAITGNKISGIITAKGFIGDGSKLTNNTVPNLSVTEVTDNFLTINSNYNNTVVLLNSLSTINISIGYIDPLTSPGLKTYFVQTNTGRGKFEASVVFNVNNFYETKNTYSVCELEFLGFDKGWTLYGDLTSTTPTTSPVTPPVTATSVLSTDSIAIGGGMGSEAVLLRNNKFYIAGRSTAIETPNASLAIQRSQFTLIPSISSFNFTQIVANDSFNTCYLALSTDGSLYHIGSNDMDYSGFGTVQRSTWSSTFTRLTSVFEFDGTNPYIVVNPKFTKIITPTNFANTFLLSGDKLFAFGSPGGGRDLGQGTYGTEGVDNASRSYFTRVYYAQDQAGVSPNITDARFKDVANRSYATLALSSNNILFCTGQNGGFILGVSGTQGNSSSPPGNTNHTIPWFQLPNWRRYNFTDVSLPNVGSNPVALSANGKLFATGGFPNVVGPGDPCDFRLSQWTLIESMRSFERLETGFKETYALSGNNWFGRSSNASYGIYGSLGVGDTQARSTFTLIPSLSGFSEIAAGEFNNYALSGNRVYATGYNNFGQLGTNDTLNRLTFTQITGFAVPV